MHAVGDPEEVPYGDCPERSVVSDPEGKETREAGGDADASIVTYCRWRVVLRGIDGKNRVNVKNLFVTKADVNTECRPSSFTPSFSLN